MHPYWIRMPVTIIIIIIIIINYVPSRLKMTARHDPSFEEYSA